MENSDKQIHVYKAEYDRLHAVFEKAADYQFGFQWPEFEKANGGLEKLKAELFNAVNDLVRWYNDGESD